jgi:glutathione S-transferase
MVKFATMKLYNADLSPNCQRVRAVIHELGLSVELIDVNLMSKDPKPEGFLAANPNGKVPAFVDDDGFTLFESRAINGYLASKRPERDLLPSDPKRRALVEQWSYWHAVHLAPPMLALAFERVLKRKFRMGEPDEAAIAAKLKEIDRFLPVLDQGLSGKEWLVDKLSLADFAVASTFPLREPSGISLVKFLHIARWLERVEALPAWQKSLPKF